MKILGNWKIEKGYESIKWGPFETGEKEALSVWGGKRTADGSSSQDSKEFELDSNLKTASTHSRRKVEREKKQNLPKQLRELKSTFRGRGAFFNFNWGKEPHHSRGENGRRGVSAELRRQGFSLEKTSGIKCKKREGTPAHRNQEREIIRKDRKKGIEILVSMSHRKGWCSSDHERRLD